MRAGQVMAVAVLLGAGTTSGRAETNVFTGTVTRVVWGDTYDVEIAGKPDRVRLNAIASPARSQAGSKEARAYARKLAKGRTVKIEMRYRDRYKRMIADVTLPDGRCLNHEMVKTGHAWHYVRYAPDDTELAAWEKEAREQKLGLWAGPDPVAPWEFQAAQRGQ